jgi:hypothetical protein
MTGALARCADSYLVMLDEPWRARRLVLLRRFLLGMAVLASVSVAAVLGFAVYMFAEGYSGGGSPHGVASLAFPAALSRGDLCRSALCAGLRSGLGRLLRGGPQDGPRRVRR